MEHLGIVPKGTGLNIMCIYLCNVNISASLDS